MGCKFAGENLDCNTCEDKLCGGPNYIGPLGMDEPDIPQNFINNPDNFADFPCSGIWRLHYEEYFNPKMKERINRPKKERS